MAAAARGGGGRRIGTMFGGSSESCALCGKTVYLTERLKASEALTFHKNCFKCNHCKSVLMIGNFALAEDGQVYCDNHYRQLFAQKTPGGPPGPQKSSWEEEPTASETDITIPPEVTIPATKPSPPTPQAFVSPAASPTSPAASPGASPAKGRSVRPGTMAPGAMSPITNAGNSPHPLRGGPIKGTPPKQPSAGSLAASAGAAPTTPTGAASPASSPAASPVGAGPRPAPPQASQSPVGARGGPGGPGPRGGPKGKFPGKAPPKAPPVDPAVEAQRKKEEEEAQRVGPVDFDAESLVEYADLDGLMKGRTVSSLKKDLAKDRTPAQLLAVLRELVKGVATPEKSQLLRNLKPHTRQRDEVIQKTTYISAALLQESNTRIIHDLVFRHNLLETLFDMLSERPPVQSIRACYLRDVLTNFIRYRREDVLTLLGATPARPALPLKIIAHIDSDELAYFLIDLIDREPPPPVMAMPKKASPKGPPPAPKAVYWSKDPEIVRALISQLLNLQETPATSDTARLVGERATENAAMVLGAILERSASHSHLVKDIISQMDRLTQATINAASSPKFDRVTFVNAMKILGQLVLCISRNWSFDETLNPKQTMLKNAVDKLLKSLPGYQALLQKPPGSSITIQPLEIFKKSLPPPQQGPLGFVRFAILEFYSEVIKASFAVTFESQILSSGILASACDVFFTYPHNTFLHDMVYNQIFVAVLIGESTNLINHLFLEGKLLRRIIDTYQGIDHPRTALPGSYHSYNGHLTLIASAIDSNRLLDGLPSNSETASLKQAWSSLWSSKVSRVIQIQTAPPKIEG